MTSTHTVSVITGGAGGMGLATARLLGRDHHLVLSDVSQKGLDAAAAELASLGFTSDTVVCDITDRAAVDRLAQQALSLGKLASVVHTAGVSPQMGQAEMIMRINAIGTINVTESFLPMATEGFSLVNVASMAAHLSPGFLMPRRAYPLAMRNRRRFFERMMRRCRIVGESQRPGIAYSISKNFVVWYSRQMAATFGAKGARIVSVSPGSFDTAMGRLEEAHGAGAMLKFAALKRFGKPEEIAEVLAFCASDRAGYLTGTDILCDGGVVAGMTLRDMLAMGRTAA